MELGILAPSALQRRAEPYKRLLGILLRPTCISISVSNPYLSLAEPAGAVLLRGGRVPERTLLKLLEPFRLELTGAVIGSEGHRQWRDMLEAPQEVNSLRQVHSVLRSASPGLPVAWWDRWSPDTPASCRLLVGPPAATPGRSGDAGSPAAGAATGAATEPTRPSTSAASGQGPAAPRSGGAGGGAGVGPPCSLGTLFLQHYLDNLGAPNTFG